MHMHVCSQCTRGVVGGWSNRAKQTNSSALGMYDCVHQEPNRSNFGWNLCKMPFSKCMWIILHKCTISDQSYRQAGSSEEFPYCKHFIKNIIITCSARSSYHAVQCTLHVHVYLQSNFKFVAKVNRGKTMVHVAPQ